jgi:glycosyltransferase involved in cell wall biosynthesis
MGSLAERGSTGQECQMPLAKNNSYLLQPRPYPARLSLVIPMYNEESVVPFLRNAVEQFMAELRAETEVILVNDGSRDSTLQQIVQWARQDARIKVVNFSRNFGHQIALTAGLDYATGDAIVTLDADLQHPLNVVHRMIQLYIEGYDVVYGQRKVRPGETWLKRFTAWLFYRLMRAFIHKDLPLDSGDFRLLSRPCLNGLQQMRENHRFLRGMIAWVGFPQIGIQFEQLPRAAGSTKYTVKRMFNFAWTAATSFSTLPLKASTWLGVIVTLVGLGEALHALLAKIFHWYVVPGWTSLTVLVSILGGATLVSIGMLGEYVGKLYEQTKNRPLYLVSQTVNVDERAEIEARSAAIDRL